MRFIFLSLLIWSLGASAQTYEVEYSHTLNKVMADDNTIQIHIMPDGQINYQWPSFSPLAQKSGQSKMLTSMSTLQSTVKQILKPKNNQNINRKLDVIKSDSNLPLFYSSEVDHYRLLIREKGQVVWEHAFDNWQVLQHHYDRLGEWQPLVDLIRQIQQEQIKLSNQAKLEVGHE